MFKYLAALAVSQVSADVTLFEIDRSLNLMKEADSTAALWDYEGDEVYDKSTDDAGIKGNACDWKHLERSRYKLIDELQKKSSIMMSQNV